MALAERIEGAAILPEVLVLMHGAIADLVAKYGGFVALAAISAGVEQAVGPFGAAEIAKLLRETADKLDCGQERAH
jgi:hypothetical protein